MDPPEATRQQTDVEGSPSGVGSPARTSSAIRALPTVPTVPDYDLLYRIGGGAYGDVWLARSKATGVLRAAKIVWRSRFEDERPFRREFEGIQRFEQISREHPSQLALFHIGRNAAQDYFYYVMELADDLENPNFGTRNPRQIPIPKSQGETGNRTGDGPTGGDALITPGPAEASSPYRAHTLRADVENGRLPGARVLEIALALTEALAHLHGCGLVHRDVKPSNVIFVNGRPKLADIGLVTDASDQCSIVGTEGYLPPEGPGTAQADIFALGKVLYEAATGLDRRQFPKLPEDLRDWPDADRVFELNEVILKACESDLRQRYKTCGEVLDELAHLQQGRSVKDRRIFRQRVGAARKIGVATFAAALAVAGGLFVWQTVKSGAPVMLVDESGEALGSHDLKAAEAYKRGVSALRRGTATDIDIAVENFNKAVETEPSFANAYARLFETYLLSEDHGGAARKGNGGKLTELSAKLQQLAPANAETHGAAAIVLFLNERRWRDAEKQFKEALTINPNCRMALTYYGYFLTRLQRVREARAVLERADRLDPSSADIAKLLGDCDYAKRNFEGALDHYLRAQELDPNYPSAYYWAGRACIGLTNYFEALRQLHKQEVLVGYDEASNAARYNEYRKRLEMNPDNPGLAFWSAVIEDLKSNQTTNSTPYLWAARYARVGDKEQALKWLKLAVENHDRMENLLFDECWDPYRKEKWFQEIAKDVRLDPWL